MKRRPEQIADTDGAMVREGDFVTILGIPDLTGMRRLQRKETEAVFRHVVGRQKRVQSVDEFGRVVLVFKILGGPSAGLHTVGIEGDLIRKVPARAA